MHLLRIPIFKKVREEQHRLNNSQTGVEHPHQFKKSIDEVDSEKK